MANFDSERPRARPAGTGLLSFGKSGRWEVAIDEPLAEPARYFLQIDGPTAYAHFEIESPRSVDGILKILQCAASRASSLEQPRLGPSPNVVVELRRDTEFEDRCFLCLTHAQVSVHLTIAGDDFRELVSALRDCRSALGDAT